MSKGYSGRGGAGGRGVATSSFTQATDLSSSNRRRSLFSYTGGKSLLVPKLNAIIEDVAITCGLTDYRELTGGSGKVLLNLPTGLFDNYWYNESKQGLANFMAAVGDQRYVYTLQDKLQRLGVGKDVFDKAKNALDSKKPLSMVDSAAYTFVVIMQSYAANRESFNPDLNHSYRAIDKYFNRVGELDLFYPFMSWVKVTNGNVFDLLQDTLDDSFALVYLDPPYSPDSEMSGNDQYEEDSWSVEQHVELARLLVKSRSKIILSGYDCPQYQHLEDNGWTKILLRNVPVPSSGSARKRADEYIWINFDISQELDEKLQQEASQVGERDVKI